jgi:dTDP-4-amino-4,6-dideoxygalactose transaminase
MKPIPFNRPYMTGRELDNIAEAHARGHLAGDGDFTRRCHAWLETHTGSYRALLTHSCTAALEMAAILSGVGAGEEVIMPSYTFVSTANAFVLRGATPVFVDVRSDTFNIDEAQVEAAITERTRVIVPVHYAGVGCDMKEIMEIASRHELLVVEDAAQGLLAAYDERALGSIGHLGAISFHETKNIISGEGGCLLVNDSAFAERAEIIREKGTNRSRFFRGEVDKYTWVDIGSSFLPSELVAAFLLAQMDEAESITERRLAMWNQYHQRFADAEAAGRLRRPHVPEGCRHNAHMYYIVLPDETARARVIEFLRVKGMHSVFHYVPLHSSPMGRRVGRSYGTLKVTDFISERLLRLPLWVDGDFTAEVSEAVLQAL